MPGPFWPAPPPQKERDKLLKDYSASQANVDELEKELARMTAVDPDRIGRLERLVADLQEIALHCNGKPRPSAASNGRI